MRTHASETGDGFSRIAATFLVLAASIAIPRDAAARETFFESAWRNPSPTDEASRPVLVPIENGRVSIAISNDDRFIYVTMTTTDRSLYYSMFRNGMTLWIDPKGGRHQTVGIRYPIGLDGDPVSERRGLDGGDSRKLPSSVPPDQWFELVGAGDDNPRRVAIGDIPGLDVRLGERDDTFVYEAKLPLVTSDDRSLVVGAVAGGTIGVGWKTDRSKSEARPPSGSMGGGSHGGVGSRAPREERGGSAGEDGPNVKPLHVWAKVRLATSEEPAGDSLRGE